MTLSGTVLLLYSIKVWVTLSLWPSRSLKVKSDGVIWKPIYDFLLVFNCNYGSRSNRLEVISMFVLGCHDNSRTSDSKFSGSHVFCPIRPKYNPNLSYGTLYWNIKFCWDRSKTSRVIERKRSFWKRAVAAILDFGSGPKSIPTKLLWSWISVWSFVMIHGKG